MSEVSPPELCECERCGVKSTWAQGFVKRKPLLRRHRTTCVTCWAYDRQYRGVYFRSAGWAVLLLLAGYGISDSASLAVLFALSFYVLCYVAVVAHELGHAATALALGFRVTAFSLGGGSLSKVVSWRKTFVLLGPSPVEGLTVLSPASTKHYRKKMALILTAGPLVNLLCAALAYWLFGGQAFAFDSAGQGIVSLWIGLNLLIVLNLLPFVFKGPFGVLRSDGLQALDLLRIGDAEISSRLDASRFTEAHLAYMCGDLERAYAAMAPALESDDMRRQACLLTTAILISAGQMQEAAELARRYLSDDETTIDERAMLMNNLACALIDDEPENLTPAKLAEADELTARAMEVAPMANAVRSTRAAVLVEKKAYREALELAADKRFRLELPRSRATVKATLALALAGLGRTDAAAHALREGEDLDPSNPHVRRARKRLAGTRLEVEGVGDVRGTPASA